MLPCRNPHSRRISTAKRGFDEGVPSAKTGSTRPEECDLEPGSSTRLGWAGLPERLADCIQVGQAGSMNVIPSFRLTLATVGVVTISIWPLADGLERSNFVLRRSRHSYLFHGAGPQVTPGPTHEPHDNEDCGKSSGVANPRLPVAGYLARPGRRSWFRLRNRQPTTASSATRSFRRIRLTPSRLMGIRTWQTSQPRKLCIIT